ncbi:hypothetical protein LTR53_000492 [Teratosphaeriaceae sp. CCFEE 6253]|nr:hypothetical protein LTR53_000492 [Teratosphaeriaceae sp. CCFEE 6253]
MRDRDKDASKPNSETIATELRKHKSREPAPETDKRAWLKWSDKRIQLTIALEDAEDEEATLASKSKSTKKSKAQADTDESDSEPSDSDATDSSVPVKKSKSKSKSKKTTESPKKKTKKSRKPRRRLSSESEESNVSESESEADAPAASSSKKKAAGKAAEFDSKRDALNGMVDELTASINHAEAQSRKRDAEEASQVAPPTSPVKQPTSTAPPAWKTTVPETKNALPQVQALQRKEESELAQATPPAHEPSMVHGIDITRIQLDPSVSPDGRVVLNLLGPVTKNKSTDAYEAAVANNFGLGKTPVQAEARIKAARNWPVAWFATNKFKLRAKHAVCYFKWCSGNPEKDCFERPGRICTYMHEPLLEAVCAAIMEQFQDLSETQAEDVTHAWTRLHTWELPPECYEGTIELDPHHTARDVPPVGSALPRKTPSRFGTVGAQMNPAKTQDYASDGASRWFDAPNSPPKSVAKWASKHRDLTRVRRADKDTTWTSANFDATKRDGIEDDLLPRMHFANAAAYVWGNSPGYRRAKQTLAKSELLEVVRKV